MNRASKLDFTFGPPKNDQDWQWYHWILVPLYFPFALLFYLIVFWCAIFSLPFLWVAERRRSGYRQKLIAAGRTLTCDQLRLRLQETGGTVLVEVRNDLSAYKLYDYEIWYTSDDITVQAPLPLPRIQASDVEMRAPPNLSTQHIDAPHAQAQHARFAQTIRTDYFASQHGQALLMIYPERANDAWTALAKQVLISNVVTVFNDLVTDGEEFKQELREYLEQRDSHLLANL